MKTTTSFFIRFSYLIIILFSTIISFEGKGQSAVPIPDTIPPPPPHLYFGWPDTINNIKTPQHIHIDQTRLFIVPPPGFTQISSVIGMHGPNQSSFIVYNMDSDSYTNAASTLTLQSLKAAGIHVIYFKELMINGFHARVMEGEGGNGMTECSILFGDSSFSNLVMATYLSSDAAAQTEIREAFKTIVYDKTIKLDPRSSAPYSIDDTKSSYRFTKAFNNILYFEDPKNPGTTEDEKPCVVTSIYPLAGTYDIKAVSVTILTGLERHGIVLTDSRNEVTKMVNGHNGYEAEVYGTEKDKKVLIYLLVVNGGDKAVSVVGMAYSNFDNNLLEFKNLAYTLSFKSGTH